MHPKLRYHNSQYLQRWWFDSIKHELSDCAESIDFFEKRAMKQFSNRELCELTNAILNGLRSQMNYLTTCLNIGDYPND